MIQQDDVLRFEQHLRETVAWCSTRVDLRDPKNCLRTPALRPENIVDSSGHYYDYSWAAVEEGEKAVAVLADTRAKLLGSEPLRTDDVFPLTEGQLLLTEPNGSLWDGLSEHDSQGFFDTADVPPWDTWVWLVGTPPLNTRQSAQIWLLSWVPSSLISVADEGIKTNCTACVGWARDQTEQYPFLKQFVGAGWLL